MKRSLFVLKNFCHFPITSCSREERYKGLPAFLYCKRRKAGRGLGTRLALNCLLNILKALSNSPLSVPDLRLQRCRRCLASISLHLHTSRHHPQPSSCNLLVQIQLVTNIHLHQSGCLWQHVHIWMNKSVTRSLVGSKPLQADQSDSGFHLIRFINY